MSSPTRDDETHRIDGSVHEFAHPYPISLPGGIGKRRLGVGGHAYLEHWTIQL